MYFRYGICHPLNIFMEFPEIHTFMVQITSRAVFLSFWVACPLCLCASGGSFRAAFNGCSPGSAGSCHAGYVDRRCGFAGLLWEAQEDFGCGREEDY